MGNEHGKRGPPQPQVPPWPDGGGGWQGFASLFSFAV